MYVVKYKGKAIEKNNKLVCVDFFNTFSWSKIKQICKAGKAGLYLHVGDTRQMVGTDGNTYTIRIVDMQEGRYEYQSDSSYTHCTFMVEELFSANNLYLYADPYSYLSQDLKDALEPINYRSVPYQLVDNDIAFFPSLGELNGRTQNLSETLSYKTNENLGMYDYFKTDTTNKMIKKIVDNPSLGVSWLTRSMARVDYENRDAYVVGSRGMPYSQSYRVRAYFTCCFAL